MAFEIKSIFIYIFVGLPDFHYIKVAQVMFPLAPRHLLSRSHYTPNEIEFPSKLDSSIALCWKRKQGYAFYRVFLFVNDNNVRSYLAT